MKEDLFKIKNRKNDTEVLWLVDGKEYKVDVGFVYLEAFIFFDGQKIVVFIEGNSNNNDFVGKVFDYQGEELYKIPFPKLNWRSAGAFLNYLWSTDIDSGVKMIFGVSNIGSRDVWYDYDLKLKKYVASGEAY